MSHGNPVIDYFDEDILIFQEIAFIFINNKKISDASVQFEIYT
jgi:hypothetical protein